jgi:hypothetical protein
MSDKAPSYNMSLTKSVKAMTSEQKIPASTLPPFSGPQVTLRIVATLTKGVDHGVKDYETKDFSNSSEALSCEGEAHSELPVDFRVSKALLQAHSPYFLSMFQKHGFQEGISDNEPKELLTLPDVLSRQSVEKILVWLYRGKLPFVHTNDPTKEISKLIEVASLAEYWQIRDRALERAIASAVHTIIMENKPLTGALKTRQEFVKSKTQWFTDEHVYSLFALSKDHPLLDVFITAGFESYILSYRNNSYEDTFLKKMLMFEDVGNALNKYALKALASAKVELEEQKRGEGTSPTGYLLLEDPFSKQLIRFPAGLQYLTQVITNT